MAESLMGVFKGEVIRLSRKVLKSHIAPLQAASTSHRRQIAELKRQIAALQKDVRSLSKGVTSKKSAAAVGTDAEQNGGDNVRFQPRGLKTLRAKLGLSAADFGLLAGVSGQTIYNWEAEKSKPRRSQLAGLATVRGIGKKEAQARLAAMSKK